MWWAIVTMTTVGYGQVVPASATGQLTGAAAAVVGIIFLSITATVISSSFTQYYTVAITQMNIPEKRPTNNKNIPGKDTLLGLLQREDAKPVSIKSVDSKDSGYGRSPVPPIDSDMGNSTTSLAPAQSPLAHANVVERNLVVSINGDIDILKNKSPAVV